MQGLNGLDLARIETPCFVVDLGRLRSNLRILDEVIQRSGARILLAQKAFSMFSVYPLLRQTLHGVCASSPHEARLGREEFGREVHAFAAAFSDRDVAELLTLADHIVFNSFAQWRRYRGQCAAAGISCGLRVNPEHSEAVAEIYSPCAPRSRLGIRRQAFAGQSLDGVSGLHFHTLCQQGAEALERTLAQLRRRPSHHAARLQRRFALPANQ
jgi:carboxynorspermidine decarboxylase